MRLPYLAIKNPSFVWMLIIFLTILGVRAYMNMPRTENPEVTVPGSSVIVVMPGAGSLDMERMVAMPLEEALNGLEDIKTIYADVRDGLAVISVEFEFTADPDEKYDEVVQQVNSMRSTLPDEIVQLDMWQWSIADMNMMQLALLSDEASFAELEERAEDLRHRVEKIPAIRKVEYYGLPEQEIHVRLDFQKMAMVHTTMDRVIGAIQSNNVNIPGGNIDIGPVSLSVKSSGSFQDLEEIRNCVVNSFEGRLIHLRDLATVEFGYEERNYLTRFGSKTFPDDVVGGRVDEDAGGRADEGAGGGQGRRGIFIGISQKEGLNVLSTAEELEPLLEEFLEDLPHEMQLESIYNQSITVKNRISGFVNNLLQGILLVALIIFLSLGIRSSLVVAMAIPLSLIIGLGFLDLSGYGLQQISIAALVVVLGMLVDNSIVMVENINRYIQLGHKRAEASWKAASEIGWPVASATLTTILAFVPIAAMPEMVGQFIRSLPLTIMFTLTVSLLIALTFTPVITSRIFREGNGVKAAPVGLGRFLHWVAERPFRKSLGFALRRPVLVLLLALLYLGGSAWMFRYIGISFFPKAEQPQLMIQATLPEGSSLARTDGVARYIETVLDTMPEVRSYATNVGHGNPRIYYNMFTHRNDKRFTELYVEVYDADPEVFAVTVQKMREALDSYPGARISVKELEQGPPYDAPIQIFVTGDDLDLLRELSAGMEDMIRAQPGAINIENQFVKTNTELYFDINKEKANMLGVPVIEIDKVIRTVVNGLDIGSFRDPEGDEFDIVLKMKGVKEFAPADLDRVYVSSMSGRQIPIRQFVDLEMRQVPSSISRYDLGRTAEILAEVHPDYSLDDVMDPVLEQLEEYSMPAGFSYHIGGELEGRDDAFGGMNNAILIAIISIFAVLVLQFRSLRQPLLVFIAIPFAFTGMIWALLITGNTFSFTAFVGLTSLVGIVVNNSIILVDYINVLRRRGVELKEALMTAAETRLVPISLTALTTIAGLLPLTLQGGSMWAPMGWTIIGGLLVSTLLTQMIVPVSYYVFERGKEGKPVS